MKMDRIEMTYRAIDEMIAANGKQRPEKFGVWNAEEEFKIYKEQVGERYTKLQWKIITLYFEDKLKTLLKEEKNDR
jgi:hypothetical protein